VRYEVKTGSNPASVRQIVHPSVSVFLPALTWILLLIMAPFVRGPEGNHSAGSLARRRGARLTDLPGNFHHDEKAGLLPGTEALAKEIGVTRFG
jgi:hypothetical protein